MKFDPTHCSQSSKNLSLLFTKSAETVRVSKGSNVSVNRICMSSSSYASNLPVVRFFAASAVTKKGFLGYEA